MTEENYVEPPEIRGEESERRDFAEILRRYHAALLWNERRRGSSTGRQSPHRSTKDRVTTTTWRSRKHGKLLESAATSDAPLFSLASRAWRPNRLHPNTIDRNRSPKERQPATLLSESPVPFRLVGVARLFARRY